MDTNPANPGPMLVIPKGQAANVFDFSDGAIAGAIAGTAERIRAQLG